MLYDDGRFGAAEATLLRGASSDGKALPPETAEILLLSKAQVSRAGNSWTQVTLHAHSVFKTTRCPNTQKKCFLLINIAPHSSVE